MQAAIEYIFPLVYEFRKEKSEEEIQAHKKRRLANGTEEYIFKTEAIKDDSESDASWD